MPAFGLYESIVVANHAKAVFLEMEPAQFQIDEDALRACVTPGYEGHCRLPTIPNGHP